ncbi:MAG: MFS transporter [Clostridia bacterium]|nr:MFS transporter [Clostridia bacterium]
MPYNNDARATGGETGKITYTGFVLMYIFSYAGIGVLMPLLSQYLAGIGFDGSRIGAVTSTARFIAIFSAAFWGRIFTFSHNRYRVIIIILIACAAFASVLITVSDFLFFIILFALFYFFQAPVCGLSDSLTVEKKLKLGPIRACGSVGYAVFVFVAGKLAESVGLGAIFPLYSAVMLIAAAAVCLLWKNEKKRGVSRPAYDFGRGAGAQNAHNATSESADHETDNYIGKPETATSESADHETGNYAGKPETANSKSTDHETTNPADSPAEVRNFIPFNPWKMLLGNRRYIIFLICAFFTLVGDAVNGTYFSFLYIEGGGSLTGVGLAFLLMAGCEAPFMLLLSKFSGRFRIEKLMLLAMIVSTARFAWYSTGPSFKMLLATFFLQGFVNSILWVEFIKYCSRLLDVRIASLGISIYYAVASNGSSIVSLLVAGFILDGLGITSVFTFAALCNFAGLLLFIIFFIRRRP